MTTTENGSIDLGELARYQHSDDPSPFQCIRCGDGIAREDLAETQEGPVCPTCAEWMIRHHGRVSYR